VVAAFLFRVSSLYAGASIIPLLPNIAPSRNRAYQAIISLRVKIEGSPIAREGTTGAKEALASA